MLPRSSCRQKKPNVSSGMMIRSSLVDLHHQQRPFGASERTADFRFARRSSSGVQLRSRSERACS